MKQVNLFLEDQELYEIPKRFIRIWFGGEENMPDQFQNWWKEFQNIHSDWEFLTITTLDQLTIPDNLKEILPIIKTKAGWSDVARILALHQYGGVYVDTDVMPLKSFDPLLEIQKPFLGKRSGKSFESAVIGSPANHPAFTDLIEQLPVWFDLHINNSASVQTGPAFVSSVLFGRTDVEHLPMHYFYPYNGFMSPKRKDKEIMFSDKRNFNSEAYAAHFSNHKWGGNPNKTYKL